jgi:signal transduction histidine kinase
MAWRGPDMLEARERLEFEHLLQWLRLSFLLSPPLVLISFGLSAAPYAVLIGLTAAASFSWVWALARLAPVQLLRFQLGLRVLDCGLVYLVLTNYHGFLRNAYYDAVYVLFVVAAAATHGRRGAWLLSGVAGAAVLLSRLQLISSGHLSFEARHLTDSAFYTIFFLITSSAVAFLMHKSAEVVERREARWRAEIAARNADLEQSAQDLAESVKVRDAMLAGVTHDLRTPLTVITAQVQLTRRRLRRLAPASVETLDAGLEQLEDAARRMARWIDELLDVSKVQRGGEIDLECSPTDLVTLVRRAVAEHQQQTQQHRFHLAAPDDEIRGDWDAGRLERVLDNLLGNAVKYSPEGGCVEVSVGSDDAGWAVVRVRDQGVGIPSDELAHVFEPFHRASNVVGRIRGLGIGLAGAYQIVKRHGGTLDVRSVEGQGSTFTVRLPRERSN